MRQKVLLAVLAVLLVGGMLTPNSLIVPVHADNLLQDMPRLDGMQIYFTEAGDEASRFDRTDTGLSRLAGLLRQAGAALHTLEWRTRFPDDADLIIIAGPTSDLSDDQTARLWSYVNNNGRLLLLADPLIDRNRALPGERGGLFTLMWDDLGMRGRDDIVLTEGEAVAAPAADAEAETDADSAPAQQTGSAAPVTFFSTEALNPNHPITADLNEALVFFGARSLEIDSSIEIFDAQSLAYSADAFYGESAFNDYLNDGVLEYNIGSDTTRGPLTLISALHNPATGTRIVLIGDREFATNGAGLQTSPPRSASFLYPGNVRLLLNAVTWLLDVEAIDMSFPTPAPTATATITPSPTPEPTATPDAGEADSE